MGWSCSLPACSPPFLPRSPAGRPRLLPPAQRSGNPQHEDLRVPPGKSRRSSRSQMATPDKQNVCEREPRRRSTGGWFLSCVQNVGVTGGPDPRMLSLCWDSNVINTKTGLTYLKPLWFSSRMLRATLQGSDTEGPMQLTGHVCVWCPKRHICEGLTDLFVCLLVCYLLQRQM